MENALYSNVLDGENVYEDVNGPDEVTLDHATEISIKAETQLEKEESLDPEPASGVPIPAERTKVKSASRSSSRSNSRSASPDIVDNDAEDTVKKADRSRSCSPEALGVRQSGSRSPSPESPTVIKSRSRTPSPAAKEPVAAPRARSRSGSRSPDITGPRSRSRSPDATGSASRSRSRSRSRSPPAADKSRSKTPERGSSSSGPAPVAQNSYDIQKAEIQPRRVVKQEAFKNAGNKPGLEIWRIEQNQPVRQDVNSYGKFYSGDCYIILRTEECPGRYKYKYDLHFWLGTDSTEEDTLSVFTRTMELDAALEEYTVQYREVQGHESSLFLSYFRNNIRYLIGGLRFSSTEKDGHKKRLFQVKGKKNIRIAQVPCMCGSLNQGDTFVLEDDKHIYVWIGPGSTRKEKLAGLTFAQLLRDAEHGRKAHIHVVQDWSDNKEFYKALGSRDKVIKAADAHDDEDIIKKLDQQTLIYKIVDDGMYELHQRPLSRDMLASDSVIVLDSGPIGIYVWVGKKCPSELKHRVWPTVQDFLATRGYPYYLPVVRVNENEETEFFKQYFRFWPTKDTEKDKKHDDVANFQSWEPDDGSGKVKVYRMQHDELVRVPSRAHGVFFASESYVIRYRVKSDEELYVIYIWQGSESTIEEREMAIKKAMTMDEKYGGTAVQVRVAIDKEPDHFFKIFQGRVTYMMDGHTNGFISLTDYEGYDPKQPYVFKIKGTIKNTKVIQVPGRPASFNSNDTFIIHSQKKRFIWIGKFAPNQETTAAKKILNDHFPGKSEPIIVNEGQESGLFWSILGSEEPYQTARRRPGHDLHMLPRLFHCILISGMFTVEELVKFNQDDLVDEDVMLLDTFDEIYMWIGKKSSEFEKQQVYRTAYTYLKVDPSSRSADDTLIIVVKQGYEPLPFVACFSNWDIDRWHKIMKFKKFVKAIEAENEEINLKEEKDDQISAFYSYDELKRKVPPEGVDVLKKEMYLRPEEFEAVFGMDKATFASLPEWKRISLKKRYSLF